MVDLVAAQRRTLRVLFATQIIGRIGPFVVSAVLFAAAAVVLTLTMRPDPAILAPQTVTRSVEGPPPEPAPGMRVALDTIAAHPSARLGVMSMGVGHLVMVGVMSMTTILAALATAPFVVPALRPVRA